MSAKTKTTEQKIIEEYRNVDAFSSQEEGRDGWQRKETGGTYSITGHEPMLTTSENNYKRSLFSFPAAVAMNQTETRSIGIHLKRKMIIVKGEGKKKIPNKFHFR